MVKPASSNQAENVRIINNQDQGQTREVSCQTQQIVGANFEGKCQDTK